MGVKDLLQTPFYWLYDTLVNVVLVSVGVLCFVPRFVALLVVNRKQLGRALATLTRDPVALFSLTSSVPFGSRVCDVLVGVVTPYSASIGAHIHTLDSGRCVVKMADRPWLRNPFNSLHAAALTNLGELTSGLLVTSFIGRRVLPAAQGAEAAAAGGVRVRKSGIPTRLSTTFFRKARGPMTCTSEIVFPNTIGTHDFVVEATHADATGQVCAKTQVNWRLRIEPDDGAAPSKTKAK